MTLTALILSSFLAAGDTRAPLPPNLSSVSSAQAPIQNPSVFEFSASADHNKVENGAPVVLRYDVEFYSTTGGALIKTQDIGKPAAADGGIVTNGSALPAVVPTLPPGVYVLRVVAVGGGGVGRSAESGPFSVVLRAPAAPSAPVIKK